TTRDQRAKNDELYDRYDSLTPREREVMTLVVAGLLNKQIAGELGTSETTVKNHRHQLMEKMGADSVAELVKMAYKLGIATLKEYSPSRSSRTRIFSSTSALTARAHRLHGSLTLPLPQRDCVAMPKSHECHSE